MATFDQDLAKRPIARTARYATDVRGDTPPNGGSPSHRMKFSRGFRMYCFHSDAKMPERIECASVDGPRGDNAAAIKEIDDANHHWTV